VKYTLKIDGRQAMNTITSHRGYEIFKDDEGFFLIGMNGLGESKRIYRDTEESLKNWIDSRIRIWLTLDKHSS
jgi:hypothetical protein